MAWYVLKARSKERWTEAEGFDWAGTDFPVEIVAEFPAKEGVSVYEVASDTDPILDLLATAFGFFEAKGTFGKVQFRFADPTFVNSLGAEVRKTPAAFGALTIAPDIMASHRELLNLTGRRVVELAKHMKDQIIKEYSSKDIATLVANHLAATTSAGWKLDKDKLPALYEAGHIRIV